MFMLVETFLHQHSTLHAQRICMATSLGKSSILLHLLAHYQQAAGACMVETVIWRISQKVWPGSMHTA